VVFHPAEKALFICGSLKLPQLVGSGRYQIQARALRQAARQVIANRPAVERYQKQALVRKTLVVSHAAILGQSTSRFQSRLHGSPDKKEPVCLSLRLGCDHFPEGSYHHVAFG
jgi:hypothetical protein